MHFSNNDPEADLKPCFASKESLNVKSIPAAALSNMTTAEKAKLANEVVRSRTRPGKAEKEALIHIFTNMIPDEVMSHFDYMALDRLKLYIKNDRKLMGAGLSGRWIKKSKADRTSLMQRLANLHAIAFNVPYPLLWIDDFPGMTYFGLYDPKKPEGLKVDTHDDYGNHWFSVFEEAFRVVVHEATHRYQDTKLIPLATNNTFATAQVVQASLMASNFQCYFNEIPWGDEIYNGQPLEVHANTIAHWAFDPFRDEFKRRSDISQLSKKETIAAMKFVR